MQKVALVGEEGRPAALFEAHSLCFDRNPQNAFINIKTVTIASPSINKKRVLQRKQSQLSHWSFAKKKTRLLSRAYRT